VSEASLGVYVHVPFCHRVCPYCDFAVVGGGVSPELEERYLAALERELELRAEDWSGRRLASLYLGGGTPSLLRAASVARIAGAVEARFPASPEGCELTLEVNPSTLERRRLPEFRSAGVSRLSVGVQSFDDGVLRRLGRAHRAGEARATLAAAREAGFDNVSIDLMFAAPGQSLAQVEADLRETAAFSPEHVSAYELVVEAGTPFALAEARGQLSRAGSDEAADMVVAIDDALALIGLLRYELTNYARPGRESVHNRRYWSREAVLGLGVGAWSCEPPREGAPWGGRSRNPRSLPAYLAGMGLAADEAAEPASREVEIHDAATARGEAVFLALRTREGLEAARFEAWFGGPPRAFFGSEISRLRADGLLEETEAGDLRLTPRGRMLSDLVSQSFVC
jgi:oxygen-independent coproporphyrinogen-3 oxidase